MGLSCTKWGEEFPVGRGLHSLVSPQAASPHREMTGSPEKGSCQCSPAHASRRARNEGPKLPGSGVPLWEGPYRLSSAAAAAAKSLCSCPTLCDPMDSSPPGSSVHGILQARILEWVAISFSNACTHAKSPQSCPTLCDPMDSSPPGSSVHGILQARILEWVAISFSHMRYIK